VRGQPRRPLIAKKASTKSTDVMTIAAAFTHHAKRDESPIVSNNTPNTT
jgi:hypothetical protein